MNDLFTLVAQQMQRLEQLQRQPMPPDAAGVCPEVLQARRIAIAQAQAQLAALEQLGQQQAALTQAQLMGLAAQAGIRWPGPR